MQTITIEGRCYRKLSAEEIFRLVHGYTVEEIKASPHYFVNEDKDAETYGTWELIN